MILALFSRLSDKANHGKILVARALEYLGASKNGLAEDELLDALSTNKDIIKDFKRRSPRSPAIKGTLPVVVWSRLYFDLEPYLAERPADGTSLLSFSHHQFREVVHSNYLIGRTKLQAHRTLVHYFGKQIRDNTGRITFNLRQSPKYHTNKERPKCGKSPRPHFVIYHS